MVLCETLAVDSKPLLPLLWEAALHSLPCPLLPAYLKSAKPWNESHIISGWAEYFTAGGRKWDLLSRDCLGCILLGAAIGRSHTVQNTLEQTIIYLSATLVRFFDFFFPLIFLLCGKIEKNCIKYEGDRKYGECSVCFFVFFMLRLALAHTSVYSEWSATRKIRCFITRRRNTFWWNRRSLWVSPRVKQQRAKNRKLTRLILKSPAPAWKWIGGMGGGVSCEISRRHSQCPGAWWHKCVAEWRVVWKQCCLLTDRQSSCLLTLLLLLLHSSWARYASRWKQPWHFCFF